VKTLLAALFTLAVAASLIFAGAALHWTWTVRTLEQTLEAERKAPAGRTFDAAMLSDLPVPAARYLGQVLVPGQRLLQGAVIHHVGQMDLGESEPQWARLRSRETVSMMRPGFVWDARVRMSPLLNVRVYDAYVAGRGLLHASLLGLITVAEAADTPAMAHGELQRWLAEAIWYPTALLPGGSIRWSALRDDAARLEVQDGEVTAALVMHFGVDGLPTHVRAEDRGRLVDGEAIPTPWVVHIGDWVELGGMRVPTRGEAAWILNGVERPYWRGTLLDVEYIWDDGGA
jgi:hypothetical protein